MDDIRLFETDGDYLVLEAQDGQKYRLLVDDTVRSSVKKEPQILLDSISITPREIQEEIRNGASIEDLVKRSGANFDFIEKFAAPVIAELEHIVSSALSVRLTIAGDRYSDSTQIEFGDIIAGRLITSGATGISWVAKKLEPNNWRVSAHYDLNGASGSATWSFDPRKLTLSPESETAITLSTQETISSSPIPKLRPVTPEPTDVIAETAVMEDVIPFGRGASLETPIAVAPESEWPRTEPATPAAFQKPEPEQAIGNADAQKINDEPLSATADLLEALRRKRTEREDSTLEPHPVTSNLRVLDFEPTPEPAQIDEQAREKIAPVEETQPTEVAAEVQKPAPKKGRAAMPSWDEIVFGTKADD